VKHRLDVQFQAPRRHTAAGLSLALFFSALAVHWIFFRRAKRDLGF
jgi:hypothetical protein